MNMEGNFSSRKTIEKGIIIETRRLFLRELKYEDVEDLHIIFSDQQSMKHYPRPFTLQETNNWIHWNLKNYAEFGFGLWGVVLKENNKLIGDCGITMQNINGIMEPEIGYHINKNYINNGYATEAAQACRNYSFEVLKLRKIYSYMKHKNLASIKVAVKNGMKLIDETKDKKNGKTRIYAITLDEYQTKHVNRMVV